jgi:hypothetical protein
MTLKQTIFNLVLYILFFSVITGCGKQVMIDQNVECKPIYVNDEWYENGPEGEDTQVLGYRIEGDCLFLKIGYGGGCKEHDIQLAASTIMGCKPPHLFAKVVHDDQDYCEAYIQEEVGFDLGTLDSGCDVIINIKGFDEQILYKGSQ